MSQLLDIIPGRSVTLGASIADVHALLKGDLTAKGWRVVSEDLASVPTKLFMVPPVSEAIGNAQCREVLLMEFGANFINWRPVTEALLPYPQTVILTPKTGGAASNAVTLGGVTVAQDPATLAAGNTAAQNLRFLYEALAGSTDPVIQDWEWVYSLPTPQPLFQDDTGPHIYGIRRTAAANQTITPNANVTATIMGNYAAAGLQNPAVANYPDPAVVTTDLVNGFIYFLQINARGLALAVRTNSSYTGPIHACWGDHARALSLVPDSGKFAKFISPIELLVGVDEVAANLGATARTAKHWDRHVRPGNLIAAAAAAHPFSRFTLAEQGFVDNNTYGANGDDLITLQGSSLWSGSEPVGNDFQIHRVSMSGNGIRQNAYVNTDASYKTIVVGGILIEDWYKFCGLATDENLQFVADSVSTSTLAQTLDGVSDVPNLALVSTAGLVHSGMVVIENEAIEYTGISGNTLTGCTRAKYATARAIHFAGASVYQGLWFIKINGGALFCGTSKPV